MTLQLKTVGDSDEWKRKVAKAGKKSLEDAWAKLGKKPKIERPSPPKAEKKAKPSEPKPAGVTRSTGTGNPQGFACPNCWGVPLNLRNDGYTIARHLPADPDAKRYRDTEFCDGQGKIAVAVMSQGWTPGTEPRQKMSAKKWRLGKGELK